MKPIAKVLVQGASRGIGLGFARLYAERGCTVVAACRAPQDSAGLQAVEREFSGVTSVRMDPGDEASVETGSQEAVEALGGSVDLLVSVSGMLADPELNLPERAASHMSMEGMERTFAVNTFGHMLVAKHLLPALRKSGRRSDDGKTAPVAAFLSARVSSMDDNRLGGWYSYRASKAALNAMVKTLSIEAGRGKSPVACALLHPGTVDTDLSKPFQKNVKKEKLFTVERSTRQMSTVLDRLEMGGSGRLYAYDGQVIPW